MLLELHIRDFAIIDRLRLPLAPAFNVLTGETGAGKSIIIDALGTLRGDKVDATAVRAGCSSARVEGIWTMDHCPGLPEVLAEYDLHDGDDDQIIISREINAQTGRSVGRVNGRAVNNATLREIGSRLVDIHGQHEGVLLFNWRTHGDILDRYGQLVPLRTEVGKVVDQLRAVRQQLDDLRRSEARRQERIDELQYRTEEITAAKLHPGEEEELMHERTLVQNSSKITTLAGSAHLLLAGSDDGRKVTQGLIDGLVRVVGALEELSRFDPSLQETLEQARDIQYRLEDVGSVVRDYRDRLEWDPNRAEEIEERFLLLRDLQRKYGGNAVELLASLAATREELNRLVHSAETIVELEQREATLRQQLGELAGGLSAQRRVAAGELARMIEQAMRDLAMPHVRFEVAMEPVPHPEGIVLPGGTTPVAFDRSGVDRIEFMVTPNPGEPLKPLARIASGGESARLLLAMKSILSSVDVVHTLVFDEVDVGIGGRAGAVVGEKLWAMSDRHQVICITHLPQVASFGDAHYTIAKSIDDGRTRSTVTLLDHERRIHEIAAMLDGLPTTDASKETARSMLDRAAQHKRERPDGVRTPGLAGVTE
ncbi:MAG: DNA repair protein RecN [Herpetosiphon sp.]